jgi:hypothetical protein
LRLVDLFKRKEKVKPETLEDRIPEEWKKNRPITTNEEIVEEDTTEKKKPGRPSKGKSKIVQAMEKPIQKVNAITRTLKLKSKNRRDTQNPIQFPQLLKIKRIIAGILLISMGISAVTLMYAYIPLAPIAILNGWILLDYIWKTREDAERATKLTSPEQLVEWLKKHNVSFEPEEAK